MNVPFGSLRVNSCECTLHTNIHMAVSRLLCVPNRLLVTFTVYASFLYKPLSYDQTRPYNTMLRNKRETAIYIYINILILISYYINGYDGAVGSLRLGKVQCIVGV